MLRFVFGPILIVVGVSVAMRPIGYATQMARWMQWVAPTNRLLAADGDPSRYMAFARVWGAFFVFGGVMVLLFGL